MAERHKSVYIVSRLDSFSISAVVYSAGEHSLEGSRSGPSGNEGREMCIHIRVALKSVVISKIHMQLVSRAHSRM